MKASDACKIQVVPESCMKMNEKVKLQFKDENHFIHSFSLHKQAGGCPPCGPYANYGATA